jgi:hypothetical protein
VYRRVATTALGGFDDRRRAAVAVGFVTDAGFATEAGFVLTIAGAGVFFATEDLIFDLEDPVSLATAVFFCAVEGLCAASPPAARKATEHVRVSKRK